jgi:PadR family transcriptional regulator, regulatory protein PadR
MAAKPAPPSAPGEFELLVLLAVLQAGRNAYGSAILAELHERAGRPVARGALYVTLDRLEAKGFLASRTEPGAPARGGRPRRYYTVRPVGVSALRDSLDALARMRAGLKLGLKQS